MPRLVFLLGEDAEGPAAMFRDREYGARQEAFRARLADSGVTAATVTTPGELETAVLQALVELPRTAGRRGRRQRGRCGRCRRCGGMRWRARSWRRRWWRRCCRPDASAVGVTTGLVGAGGFGKTTLARMVAHDPRVRAEFAGGVVWVTVGEDAGGPELAAKLVSAARLFDPAAPEVTDPLAAGAVLGRALAGRRVLLVVDDVWSTAQVEPFLVGGDRGGAVVHHPPARGAARPGGPGAGGSDGRRARPTSCSPPGCRRCRPGWWRRRCGRRGGGRCCWRWCTARSGTPSGRAGTRRSSCARCWRRCEIEGITALDATNPGERGAAVAATIEVSLRRLTPDEQARYRELAVFGEDVAIPGEVVARLWAHTGGWTRFQARRLCRRLFDLGLLAGYRRNPDRLVLHDVIRAYLRETTREQRAEWDAAVVDAHRDLLPAGGGWADLPAERGVPVVVVGDAPARGGSARRAGGGAGRPAVAGRQAGAGRAGRVWSRTCGCPSGRGRGRWRSWCGRTRTCSARSTRPGRWRRRSPPGCPTTPAWTSCASRSSPPSTGPHLRSLAPLPDLPHDALLRVLTGHTGGVAALAVAPDGSWLASAGDDGDGADLGPAHRADPPHPHRPHRRGAGVGGRPGRHLAGLRQRRRDGADLGPAHRADPPHPHRPHRRGAGAGGRPGRHLAGLRQRRRRRCGSGTRTPGRPATPSPATPARCRRWRSPRTAPGWPPPATTATVRIWDPHTGQTRHTLTGHTGWVPALAVAPDGTWLASAGDDGDGADLGPAHRADPPHPHRPHRRGAGVGGRPGRHLAGLRRRRRRRCGSGTRTPGRPATPSPATPTRCGRWRSPRTAPGWPPPATTGRCGSGTRTPGRPATPSPATPTWVRALAVAPDGTWLASASDDGTVRIWDPHTGQARHTLTGHTRLGDGVGGRPGRHLAGLRRATTRTVRIWDPHTGQARHTLTGHTGGVAALAVAPDGTWLASAS